MLHKPPTDDKPEGPSIGNPYEKLLRPSTQTRPVRATQPARVNGPDFPGALDFAALADSSPPARRWAWDQWTPAGAVTLLHGDGGTGKTLIAQMLGTAYATGRDLFAAATEGGRALMVAAEDDHDELWRRQRDICTATGVDMADLAGAFEVIPGDGSDLTMVEAVDAGAFSLLPAFDRLRERCRTFKPGLVILDNAAVLFDVPEQKRSSVTRVIGVLRGLARDHECSVLLLSHDNRSGDFSGSTAWNNAVRSRLHLTRDDDTVELKRAKANYAAAGAGTLRLRWGQGVYRHGADLTPEGIAAAEAQRREHAEVFLAALDKLTEQGVNVSHSDRAGNFAPKVIEESGLGGDLSRRDLETAMRHLLNEKVIVANAEVGRRANRTLLTGIARTKVHEG